MLLYISCTDDGFELLRFVMLPLPETAMDSINLYCGCVSAGERRESPCVCMYKYVRRVCCAAPCCTEGVSGGGGPGVLAESLIK